MQKKSYITLFLLMSFFVVFSQENQESQKIEIKGSVKEKETRKPISNVQISTSSGKIEFTNAFGEFKILVAMGEELIIEHFSFETLRHIISSRQDIDVLVKEESESEEKSEKSEKKRSVSSVSLHETYLDSANQFKKKDIGKSIDYILQSMGDLSKRGNKKERAASLSLLGEIYKYHRQYDLAITNFEDALLSHETVKTNILLGETYLLNKDFVLAETIFLSLSIQKNISNYEKIQIYEGLGDVYKGLGDTEKSVTNYNKGLTIAKDNIVTPKITDINSKIGEAYAEVNQVDDAEEYFDSSLNLASQQAPERALQENEKVADFYNKNNEYDKEIELRKKSLEVLPKKKGVLDKKALEPNIITPQRINYKIANALIVQGKDEEAIPYLEQSVVDANDDGDLVVKKDALLRTSEVYERRGEDAKALKSLQEYAALVDTLYARKEQEISQSNRLNRKIANKQNRISGLEKDRELSINKYSLALTEQQLTDETNKRQRNIIYFLGFGMLLLGLVVFFFYRSNKQQKLANNLLALKSLRSQMNPHFIFNALNSVNNYIAKSDERSANRYLSDFSTLMRAVLENSEEDFISLSKELELLELYVKLEHSRFPDKFDYKIEVDEHIDVAAFQIPPMLLQPYIENAIWHGLRYKNEKGFLNIDLKQKTTDSIEINIQDNGIGRKKSAELKTQNQKKQRSKGMGNIKKRVTILNEMYKDRVDVFVNDLNEDSTGTKVVLILRKD